MRSWPRSSSPGRDRAIASRRRPAFLDDEHLLSFQDDKLIGYDLASGELAGALHGHGPDHRRSPSRVRASSSASTAPGGAFRIAIVDATTWTTVTELPVPVQGSVLFEIVPSADGRRLAVSDPELRGQNKASCSTSPPASRWARTGDGSGLMSAALPDGGFLVAAFGQLRRRSATGEQLGPALNLHDRR